MQLTRLKSYNTKTGELVIELDSEALYINETGDYFLHVFDCFKKTEFTKGFEVASEKLGNKLLDEYILPLSENQAKTWHVCALTAEEHNEIFGDE